MAEESTAEQEAAEADAAEEKKPEPPKAGPDRGEPVVIDGVAHFPDGDVADKARFLGRVAELPTQDKREVLEAIGGGHFLSTPGLEGELSDEQLTFLLLGTYLHRVEQRSLETGMRQKLHRFNVAHVELEPSDPRFHLEVAQQTAENLEARRFVRSAHIKRAFESVPRSWFMAPGTERLAVIDAPLEIGSAQTISQPSTVAMMLEMLGPQPGDRVLDVGCGSGWTTGLLGHIAGPEGSVVGVEVRPELVTFGQNNIKRCEFPARMVIAHGDPERLGWEEGAPYDRILVSAGTNRVPAELKRQLAVGGKMVIPVADGLVECVRTAEDEYEVTRTENFVFVPLVESAEPIRSGKRLHLLGGNPQLRKALKRRGYELDQESPYGFEARRGSEEAQLLDGIYGAYESDLLVIVDRDPERPDRELGIALGSVLAGKEKRVYLVGKRAADDPYARLPFVEAFPNTRALLRRLDKRPARG